MTEKHISVLLQESIEGLSVKQGGVYVDATLGAGGHTEALCRAGGGKVTIIALDADKQAIDRTQQSINAPCELSIYHRNFADIDDVISEAGHEWVDGILFDLGVNSFQIGASGRGFSFMHDEPLDMTFGKREGNSEHAFSATDIVNNFSADTLADVLFGYAEEQYSRRIAQAIVTARSKRPITRTRQLVDIIEDAVPYAYRKRKIHPATKTFQALRIAVNNEVANLRVALHGAYKRLRSGGRLSVISFHSLEDRIVKHFFKTCGDVYGSHIITKKPIVPTDQELHNNPRSRSAKLRILEK